MGFISSIPYLAYFLMINIGGFVADTVQHKKLLSTLNTRRVAMIAGNSFDQLLTKIAAVI